MTVGFDQSNSVRLRFREYLVQILAEDWLSWFPSVTVGKCSHITLQ